MKAAIPLQISHREHRKVAARPQPRENPTLRTITIQADKPLDAIMGHWLAHLVLAIPIGPDGIKFDGDLYNGTTVNQRKEGQWTVSFRPNPDGSKRRSYSNPYAVARVIIAREHETEPNLLSDRGVSAALRAPEWVCGPLGEGDTVQHGSTTTPSTAASPHDH